MHIKCLAQGKHSSNVNSFPLGPKHHDRGFKFQVNTGVLISVTLTGQSHKTNGKVYSLMLCNTQSCRSWKISITQSQLFLYFPTERTAIKWGN